MSKKTTIIIVLAIVVLVLLGLKALKKSPVNSPAVNNQAAQDQNQTKSDQQNVPTIPQVNLSDVPKDKLPEGFVASFPLESGAEILNNYTSKSDAGLQSTRRFVSKKTLDANFKLYSDYLKQNHWTINGSTDSGTIRSISAASPDGISVNITIAQNTLTKQNEVEITFFRSK